MAAPGYTAWELGTVMGPQTGGRWARAEAPRGQGAASQGVGGDLGSSPAGSGSRELPLRGLESEGVDGAGGWLGLAVRSTGGGASRVVVRSSCRDRCSCSVRVASRSSCTKALRPDTSELASPLLLLNASSAHSLGEDKRHWGVLTYMRSVEVRVNIK